MTIDSSIYDNYVEGLLDGDRGKCQEIVEDLLSQHIDHLTLYEHLFRRSLYDIGKLWEHNKISVSAEHLATTITESIMNGIFPSLLTDDYTKKTAVVSCIEKEEHQVGGKMVADIFETHGWDTYYLGSNTPTIDLIEFCSNIKPTVICLSLTVYFNLSVFIKEIDIIRSTLDTPIFIGGQALVHIGPDVASKLNNVYYFHNLYELDQYLEGESKNG